MYRESSSSRQKHRLGSLFWSLVALFFGWTVYIYWWRKVILSEESRVFIGLMIWLASAIVILALGAALWIAHNQRIARRGNRGLATRFFALEQVSDRLGRTLEMPDRAALRSSPRIVIQAKDDLKAYSIDEWGEPPR